MYVPSSLQCAFTLQSPLADPPLLAQSASTYSKTLGVLYVSQGTSLYPIYGLRTQPLCQVLTLKTAMVSLQSLLCSPEPKDPQDAEVNVATCRAVAADELGKTGSKSISHRSQDL